MFTWTYKLVFADGSVIEETSPDVLADLADWWQVIFPDPNVKLLRVEIDGTPVYNGEMELIR